MTKRMIHGVKVEGDYIVVSLNLLESETDNEVKSIVLADFAKFIVRACNNHDALVEALRFLIYTTCSECIDYNTKAKLETNMCMRDGCDTINKCKEVLAQAKEG